MKRERKNRSETQLLNKESIPRERPKQGGGGISGGNLVSTERSVYCFEATTLEHNEEQQGVQERTF